MRFPNIAIAQNGNRCDFTFELSNRFPTSRAAVVLFCRACVQCDSGHAFFGGNMTRFYIGNDVVADADAKFASNGNVKGPCCFNGRTHNGAQQIALHRHCCPTAFSRDFVGGTTKVHIDVVNQIVLAQIVNGSTNKMRITSVNLHTAEILIGSEAHHFARAFIAVH